MNPFDPITPPPLQVRIFADGARATAATRSFGWLAYIGAGDILTAVDLLEHEDIARAFAFWNIVR